MISKVIFLGILISSLFPLGDGIDVTSEPITRSDTSDAFLNFTYLENGAFGSTAYRVTDGDIVIYIEAFPHSDFCKLKPSSVSDADIIIQESHGHGTHYDKESVALVHNNTNAYIVGNKPVINDMKGLNISEDKLIEINPTSSSKVTTSIQSLNVKITAYSMPHTGGPTINVVTFLIEMPNGLKWFHGTCYSDPGSDKEASMKQYNELKNLDVMLIDFDHNFGKVDSHFKPMVIGKTHDYQSTPYVNEVWLDYPNDKKVLNHGDFFNYPPDWTPSFLSPSFSPFKGDTDTKFNLSVIMKYRPNIPPTSAKINIEGSLFDLVSTGDNYRTGVEYYYQSTLKSGTDHDINFEFEVDGNQYFIPLDSSPEVNSIPILQSNDLYPLNGDDDMDYTFKITYLDGDGDYAIDRSIIIDGESFSMAASSSNPIEGIEFTYTSKLSVGDHNYHFKFSDGKNNVRYPSEGELNGPTVIRANYPPSLTDESYNPPDGTRDTEFGFGVKYKDSHGDEPTLAQVIINGNPFNMTKMSGHHKSGAIFVYKTSLDLGKYTFHFLFSDGEFEVRLPDDPEEEFNGPTVYNRDPKIDIFSPNENSNYRDDELILLDASNSSDPDGDDLQFTWTSNIDGNLGNEPKVVTTLSEGNHIISALIEDPFGGSDEIERNILVIHYEAILRMDLTIDPDDPSEENEITVVASIFNSGNENSESLILNFNLDGENLRSASLQSLVAGKRKEFEVTFQTEPGDHVMTVAINNHMIQYLNFSVDERDPPVAVAGIDIDVELGEKVNLDASGSTFKGILQLIEWNMDDGIILHGMAIEHIFTQPGSFNVTLTIKDDLGKESEDIITITVNKPKIEEEPIQSDNDDGNNGIIIVVISIILILIVSGIIGIILIQKKRKPAENNNLINVDDRCQ